MGDTTERSQMEPSGTDDKSTAGAAQSSGGSWLISMFCLLALLVLFAAAILIFSGDVGAAESVEGDPPASGEDGSSGPSGPSGPSSTHSRKKITTVATEATDEDIDRPEGQPTISTKNTEPTTTAPTKKPYTGPTRKPGLFVCWTPTGQLQPGAQFTIPDGLCDVTLIGVGCSGELIDELLDFEYYHSWLFGVLPRYQKTKFGFVVCHMDYEYIMQDMDDKYFFKEAKKHPLHYYGIGMIKQLWRSIFFGPDLNAPFVYVKTIRDRLFQTAEIVYMVEIDSPKNFEYFVHMCKNTTMPDLIVVVAHDFFPAAENQKQVVLPPNIFYRPIDMYYEADYGHTMFDAMTEALHLLREGLSRPIALMLTVAAAHAKVQFPDHRNPKVGRYAIYQPAVYQKATWYTYFDNAKKMCSEGGTEALRENIQYQENALTWLTFNKSYRVEQAFAFDTAETLRYKMCHMFVNYTTEPLFANISFGVADALWDQVSCDLPKWKSPPYERVSMVRAVYHFMAKEFWDPSDLYFCMRVKP